MSTDIRNALRVGTRIAEFRVEAVEGAGSFGIVYRAWDEDLKRTVAIKEYLPSDFAVRMGDSSVRARSGKDEDTFAWGLERFLDEARMLARFDHPNIVKVFQQLRGNGTAYMVMEYVGGERLRDRLSRQGRLAEEEVRGLLEPLLEGLALVHGAGAVHRDIKPENICFRGDGVPVLLDFGAAREAVRERSHSMTRVFTPPYAPLEQYGTRGAQGPWTDLYALGAVVYEALSGQKIPEATDRLESDPLTPLSKAARVSAPMSHAVTAALAVYAVERPQTVEQWRHMLRPQKAPPRPAPKTGESRGGIWHAIFGIVAGLAVWAIGTFLLIIPFAFLDPHNSEFRRLAEIAAAMTLSGLPAGYLAGAASRRPALFGLVTLAAGLVGGVVDLGTNWHEPDWRYSAVYRDLFLFFPALPIFVGGYLRARRAESPAVQQLVRRSVIATIIGVIGVAVIMTVAIVLPERLRPHFTAVFDVPNPEEHESWLFGIAVAGDDIWVARRSSVMDLRAGDTTERWVAKVDHRPDELAFDGTNIWVTHEDDGSVTKLRASDGRVLGTFGVGGKPTAIAFDGVNVWVANQNNNVTKLRATDGKVLGTYGVGEEPRAIAFDRVNVWVANFMSNNVTKLRALDGRALGTFPVGRKPGGLAFDGTNMWITSRDGDGVTKLRGSDGMKLGTFDVGARSDAIAFDGTNLWLTNVLGVDVTELRGSDGVKVGTYRFGDEAWRIVVEGKNVWVANYWHIAKRALVP